MIKWKGNDPIFYHIAKKHDVPFARMKAALLEEFLELESGKINADQWISFALAKFGKRINGKDSGDRLLLDPFVERAKLRKGTAKIIETLRKKGFKVYALTNTSLPHLEYMKKAGWAGYFDGFYSSCELGRNKPDPMVYKKVLRLIGARPDQTVFIDDKRENITGAENAGIYHTIRFTALPEFRSKIKSIIDENDRGSNQRE